jgi:hypothetical protein
MLLGDGYYETHFCGLGFSSTSRSGWCATKLKMQRSCKRQVTSIRQGSYYQSSRVTKILITVQEFSIYGSNI